MLRNFQITQGVELSGEFGVLDIHNAYDLDRWEFRPAKQNLTLEFAGNEYRLHNRPPRFELAFAGVTVFETMIVAGDIPEFVVEQIGFKASGDQDYAWLLEEHQSGDVPHLVLRAEEGSIIRVAADSGRVIVPGRFERADP